MKRQQAQVSDDPDAAQVLDDERLAILLQNEEFVRELRNNKDFMTQLQRDASGPASAAAAGGQSGSSSSSSSGNFSDAAFREMLKNMSKVSRRKFAQVAGMFSRRKRYRSDGFAGFGAGSDALSSPGRHMSRDHLLASGAGGPSGKEGDEYRALENDSSDSEERSNSPYWEQGTGTASRDACFVGYRSPEPRRSATRRGNGHPDHDSSGFHL